MNYREVPGKPDITLTRDRTAVFVDECFWHRCPIHCRIPRKNRDWWRVKPDRNVTRDREKDAALTALGWLPVHYWGHDDVDEVADEIEGLWRELRGVVPGTRSSQTRGSTDGTSPLPGWIPTPARTWCDNM